jgi:hypothetical protein
MAAFGSRAGACDWAFFAAALPHGTGIALVASRCQQDAARSRRYGRRKSMSETCN